MLLVCIYWCSLKFKCSWLTDRLVTESSISYHSAWGKNLRAAKHRFESLQKPTGRLVLHMAPMMICLEQIARERFGRAACRLMSFACNNYSACPKNQPGMKINQPSLQKNLGWRYQRRRISSKLDRWRSFVAWLQKLLLCKIKRINVSTFAGN